MSSWSIDDDDDGFASVDDGGPSNPTTDQRQQQQGEERPQHRSKGSGKQGSRSKGSGRQGGRSKGSGKQGSRSKGSGRQGGRSKSSGWVLEGHPLHQAVVERNLQRLREVMDWVGPARRYADKYTHPLNGLDMHGVTALHLAVILGWEEGIEALIAAGASVTLLSRRPRYAVYHEAVATSNVALFVKCLGLVKDTSREVYATKLPHVYATLDELPDFSMAIDWEVSSWIPFVTRLCPNDTYVITKVGRCLRVDLTLLGREGKSWIRGNVSYVFHPEAPLGVLYRVDHDAKTVSITATDAVEVDDEEIAWEAEALMRSEISMSDVALEDITFAPATTWLGGPKSEVVSGYTCSVIDMSNIKVTSLTRDEHLSPKLKAELEAQRARMEELEDVALAAAENGGDGDGDGDGDELDPDDVLGALSRFDIPELTASLPPYSPLPYSPATSWDAYLAGGVDVLRARPVSVKETSKTLKASLWCSPEFPLTVDQFRPLLMLLAPASPEFKEIEAFFEQQVPRDYGFPVQFQLPLYKVFKAEATFRDFTEIDASDPAVADLVRLPADYVLIKRRGGRGGGRRRGRGRGRGRRRQRPKGSGASSGSGGASSGGGGASSGWSSGSGGASSGVYHDANDELGASEEPSSVGSASDDAELLQEVSETEPLLGGEPLLGDQAGPAEEPETPGGRRVRVKKKKHKRVRVRRP